MNTKEIKLQDKTIKLETGKIAKQTSGSVMVTSGDTVVLVTVCASKGDAEDRGFFPLSVDYREKFYAAGRIPGGFFKREARPTESETLISRLIDRPIRPLFHKDFKNETQVTCTVLSHDQENDSDIVALIATSAAVTLSGLPFMGPLGATKIGLVDDKLVVNPTIQEIKNSKLDLVVAGTKNGVLMVESEAHQLSEEKMLEAVVLGQESYLPVIDAIISLAKKAAKEPWDIPEKDSEIANFPKLISDEYASKFSEAYQVTEKQKRVEKLKDIKSEIEEKYVSETLTAVIVSDAIKSVEKDIVRGELLKTGNRIDGRDTKTVRPIAVSYTHLTLPTKA